MTENKGSDTVTSQPLDTNVTAGTEQGNDPVTALVTSGNVPTTAAEVRSQRQAEVYRRHLDGEGFRSIAAALGISVKTAHKYWEAERDAVDHLDQASTPKLRATARQRAERLWAAIMPGVLSGSPKHIDVAIRLLERTSRLLGLDHPSLHAIAAKVQVTGGDWHERSVVSGPDAAAIATALAAMSPDEREHYFSATRVTLDLSDEDGNMAPDAGQRLAKVLSLDQLRALEFAALVKLGRDPNAPRVPYREGVVVDRHAKASNEGPAEALPLHDGTVCEANYQLDEADGLIKWKGPQ